MQLVQQVPMEQQALLGGYPKDSVAETANADKIGSAGSTGSAGSAGHGIVDIEGQTAEQALASVRAAAKSSNTTYKEAMQSVADFAAGGSGMHPGIDIARSYMQLYRSGFGSILRQREYEVAKALEHAYESRMKGKFTDGMSQFVDGVLSGVPK